MFNSSFLRLMLLLALACIAPQVRAPSAVAQTPRATQGACTALWPCVGGPASASAPATAPAVCNLPPSPYIIGCAHIMPAGPTSVAGAGVNGLNPQLNMTYHGGPVIHSAKVYLIGWLPTGTHWEAGGSDRDDLYVEQLFSGFFQGIAPTPHYAIATQYPDQTGSGPANSVALSGQALYTAPFPRVPVMPADVTTAIAQVQSQMGWSSCADCIFFLDLPFNVQAAFEDDDTGFCGYHSFFQGPSGQTFFALQSTGNCPQNDFLTIPHPNSVFVDQTTDTTAHELFETVTDPMLNAWFETNISGEIADKCVSRYAPQNPDGSNLVFSSGKFVVQQEWSNAQFNGAAFSGCVMSFSRQTSTVSLFSSPNPSSFGQPVTFVANVTCTGFIPTGNVTFSDGATVIATERVLNGTSTLGTSAETVGSHSITADYLGDANCPAAISPPVTQMVIPAGPGRTLGPGAGVCDPTQSRPSCVPPSGGASVPLGGSGSSAPAARP